MAKVPPRGSALLAAGLAAGLAVGAVPAHAANTRPTITVSIGYENAPDPEAVAIEQHFFQKYMHARVVLRYFSDGPLALTDLASGRLDFMTTLGNPPTASAIADGVPLRVVWAMERYTTGEGLVVSKSSHITSLQQLKGKTVALVKGSTSPFELDTALKQHHIPVSSVTQLNMTPPEMVAAWKTHRLVAAYTWVPFVTAMAQSSGHMLMYDQNVYRQAPIFNLAVVNAKWAAAHPRLVEGFVAAEQAGVRFFHQHPQQAYADMGKLNHITAAQAKAQTKGFSFTSLPQELTLHRMGNPANKSSSLVAKSLTAAVRWLYQTHQISHLPKNMSSYIAPRFVQAVLHGHG